MSVSFIDVDLHSGSSRPSWANKPHKQPSFMRRVSQPTTQHHSIKQFSSQFGSGGSSSQTELRRLRVGGSRESNAEKLLLSPNESKITTFAQSVLALHKIQDNTGAYRSHKRKSYFDSGSGLSGYGGYRVCI